jgi:hypothetical protein
MHSVINPDFLLMPDNAERFISLKRPMDLLILK